MALEDLDLVDRKILAELDRNARISYSELGKRTRIAKETVKYRITQLEKKGIIDGYYTVINNAKTGYLYYRLYLRLQNSSPAIEQEIEEYFKKSKYISVLFTVDGPYTIVLGIWVKNIWEYERFWLETMKTYGEYIGNYQLSVMSNYVEFSKSYICPEKDYEKIGFSVMEESAPQKLNENETAVLRFIASNARASLVEIAKETKISIVTARKCLIELRKNGVVLGYRTAINIKKIGRQYYKVDLWLKKFKRYEEIASFVRALPETTYAERTVLTSDVEFDVEVTGFDEFTKVMERIKNKFPEEIKDYRYYSRIASKKVVYVPKL
ncbi:MAG: winged helix-turn-helix transcriptional regulator [Candidatus Micrarchaeia archaeon]|jgi:DNA-binding Lrp family transcriptional regulator